MTKTIGNDLKAHLASNLSTIATCCKITRTDAVTFCFTDHDVDIDYGGDTYEATSGMIPTALEQTAATTVDNMETQCFLESDKIDEADIAAGLFDGATVDLFILNYDDTSMGVMYLCQGWRMGNVIIEDNVAKTEVRGKAQLLTENIVELYSPGCRAEFCDSRCGLDAELYTCSGIVTSVTDRRTFKDNSRVETEDLFRYGKLTWTAGASAGYPSLGTGDDLNVGYTMEVKSYDHSTKEFELFESMPYEIAVGDTYLVVEGCDKSWDTCKTRFFNTDNFRGEPFVPGPDKVTDYKTGP